MTEIDQLLHSATVAIVLQWIAFVPAYLRQTERFYDLVGAATYLLLLGFAARLAPQLDSMDWLLLAACAIWAIRLGSFLAYRVHVVGSDVRFNQIKKSASRFLVAWSVQGLWVFLTLSPVLIVTLSPKPHIATIWTWLGLSIWLLGFVVEVVADQQKWRFKRDSANKGKFIQSGLWAFSRHPNYAGEICLWIGLFIACTPLLEGWQWVGLISPFFIYFLLTRISGIPILENNAKKRWGKDADYGRYCQNVPVLWPRLGRSSAR